MKLPEIDFSRIRPSGTEGQRSGFEQFVCELAAEDPPHPDAVFVSLHGAGGDGGVECFWTLSDGTEVGWQAKFWLTNDQVDGAKRQLGKSVTTALAEHPKLVEYIIAIPVDPTGPRRGKGKSLYEKVCGNDGWLSGWEEQASQLGRHVRFRVEWATNLITRFRKIDTSGVRTRYWFDTEILADQWWRNRLEEAVQAARPRYLPELSVRVPVTLHALAALCGDPEWVAALDSDISDLQRLIDSVRRDPFEGKQDSLRPSVDLEPTRQRASELADALAQWRDRPSQDTVTHLRAALTAAQNEVLTAEEAESAALTAQHGPHWDTASWRQTQAEYMVSLPATAVDALRALREFLAELASHITGPVERLREARAVLLTSEAGQGKTFVTLDTVKHRLESGRPGLFLHGRQFREGDILDQIRARLVLPPDLNGEDTLALLNQAGRTAAGPVLVIIDALNESRPRTLWQDELDALVTKINRYGYLRVVFTLRSHYRSHVLPDDLDLPEIVHRGFEGVEYDAMKEYADFYHLEPPPAPPVQAEFSSPLFLRLLCEALRKQGRRSLVEASMGLDDLVSLLLEQINRRISKQLNALETDQIVHQAMHAFAEALGAGTQPWFDRASANALMRNIWPDHQAETSLLDALVGEGLLAEDTDPGATGPQRHVVAMAFERLGQHLVISAATSALNTAKEVRRALASGSLRTILGLDALPDPGLLEALSVILGHRDMELTDFRDEVGDEQAAAAVVAGLPWRSEASITERTTQSIFDALSSPETFPEAMDMLFRLAPRPDHPLNADFIDHLLSARSMAAVDAFFTPWLYETREAGGAAHRLISWARTGDLTRTSPQTCRLWVTALLWCTGCSDRRVRDDATLGAARLLIQHPDQAPATLAHFLDASDDWIAERACYAAYTALLRAGSEASWHKAAEAVWEKIFSTTPPANAALRDAARSIIDAAHERGALPDTVDLARTQPPYDSPWPITWSTDEDVQSYKDAENDYPKLHFSCTADDFVTYIITPALRDRPDVESSAVARRVVQDVVALGYEPDLHAHFDRYVLGSYGRGRSKPKWIERLGKKYQWIALARLLGQISDHVPRSRSRWDPPEPAVPGPQTERLRQMDPTLCDAQPDDTAPSRPHVPAYDWQALAQTSSPEDWIADDSDLPDVPAELTRNGTSWIVLAGNYEWRQDEEPENNRPTIWAHTVSLFVQKTDLSALLEDVDGKDLTNHVSRISGSMFTDGFVGEYPFGHHYAAEVHVRDHEHEEPFAVATSPTTYDILGEYEYSPISNLSLIAPAPELFGPAPGELHWDGRSAWHNDDGQVAVAVRKVFGGGQNELTVDRSWLDNWLHQRGLTIVWLETIGKDILRTRYDDGHPGRLLRTRVRYRDPNGKITQLQPVAEHIAPWSRTEDDTAASE